MSEHFDNPKVRALFEEWANGFAESMEMMLGERPEVRWSPAEPPRRGTAMLWWQQKLSPSPDWVLSVGAPLAQALAIGHFIFSAAGSEAIEDAEARNTYLEVVSQSFSGLLKGFSTALGSPVNLAEGAESASLPPESVFATLEMQAGEQPLGPLTLAIGTAALGAFLEPETAAVLAPPRASRPAPAGPSTPERANGSRLRSRTMDLLLDVELPVSISFGRARIPLKDALKLSSGSIVELNRDVNEPVEVIVNNCVIARGEVVIVDGNYGVRIQEIMSRDDRLRSIR
jgi:flagellar motor switch protein FliN